MPFSTSSGGSPTNTTVSVLSTVTLVLAARVAPPWRAGFIIQNQSTVDIFWGGSMVTASGPTQGILLKGNLSPPATFTDSTIQGAIYAIVATGSAQLNV